ncbi:hypothetical protein [Pseudomonas citronellolis]|uniref:hypothetical protein n=1 Tax=Pseudomonas citronellolis TaxID=53408 RepID=UPI002FDA5387
MPALDCAFFFTLALALRSASLQVNYRQWVLYERPIELSREQIEQFRKPLKDNHRPALGLEGREIDED